MSNGTEIDKDTSICGHVVVSSRGALFAAATAKFNCRPKWIMNWWNSAIVFWPVIGSPLQENSRAQNPHPHPHRLPLSAPDMLQQQLLLQGSTWLCHPRSLSPGRTCANIWIYSREAGGNVRPKSEQSLPLQPVACLLPHPENPESRIQQPAFRNLESWL